MEYCSVMKWAMKLRKDIEELECMLLSEKSQSIKATYGIILTLWHSETGKNMETVDQETVGQKTVDQETVGQELRVGGDRGLLDQWNYSVWWCSGGYKTLCICQNPWNVHHQEWTLMYTVGFNKTLSIFREGNGTPLQYSCLENPMDGGAWWAAVHGVTKSPAQLSNFTLTFHFHALEEEMTTRSSVLAWRIPGMGEPGGLPSMGLHRVGHDWSNLAAAAVAVPAAINIGPSSII